MSISPSGAYYASSGGNNYPSIQYNQVITQKTNEMLSLLCSNMNLSTSDLLEDIVFNEFTRRGLVLAPPPSPQYQPINPSGQWHIMNSTVPGSGTFSPTVYSSPLPSNFGKVTVDYGESDPHEGWTLVMETTDEEGKECKIIKDPQSKETATVRKGEPHYENFK